jgi:hypothetical protein
VRRFNQSAGTMCFTQTAGIHADGDTKTICILMIYFPNALAENANTGK